MDRVRVSVSTRVGVGTQVLNFYSFVGRRVVCFVPRDRHDPGVLRVVKLCFHIKRVCAASLTVICVPGDGRGYEIVANYYGSPPVKECWICGEWELQDLYKAIEIECSCNM